MVNHELAKELRANYSVSNTPLFTSDLHFEHKRIVEYAGRPWTQERQQQEIIDRWNSRVGPVDNVYHLGDFAFIWPKKLGLLLEIINELHGNIHFIRGNHCDPNVWERVLQANIPHVAWVKDYHEMKVEGQKVVLCHYPMEVWNGSHHGSWMLHGHCHGSLPQKGKRLDCGIDNHPEFQIWTWDEIKAHMAKQEWVAASHHGQEGER